ncbi:MAG: hypothetical protein EA356_07115 [Geminicoccaceae bacterium]|nr:MAG: hypothetical protein EA356_07115 [Geminicoccaceae bacterium]
MSKHLAIRLDDDTAARLDTIARRSKRTPEALLQLALVDYLVRFEAREREAAKTTARPQPTTSHRVEKADVAAWLAEL